MLRRMFEGEETRLAILAIFILILNTSPLGKNWEMWMAFSGAFLSFLVCAVTTGKRKTAFCLIGIFLMQVLGIMAMFKCGE